MKLKPGDLVKLKYGPLGVWSAPEGYKSHSVVEMNYNDVACVLHHKHLDKVNKRIDTNCCTSVNASAQFICEVQILINGRVGWIYSGMLFSIPIDK